MYSLTTKSHVTDIWLLQGNPECKTVALSYSSGFTSTAALLIKRHAQRGAHI